MRGHGSQTAKICILGSGPASVSARAEGLPFGASERSLLESALLKGGVHPSQVYYLLLGAETLEEINTVNPNIIVTLGREATKYVTGKTHMDKWQLSPLDTLPEFTCRKAVPTFNFRRLNTQYDHRFYFYSAILRACENQTPGPWQRKQTNFHINLSPSDAIDYLRKLQTEPVLSADIETSHGIINTLGFAHSANDAIAVRCRPEDMSATEFYEFWRVAAEIIESPDIGKIYQNNIFEASYFNRYGITAQGTYHDTMWAQKVLYPEFKCGLGNVARIHTMEPYWKDDGTVSADGGKRDWNKIDDWNGHLLYNCKDTAGTFEAYMHQREELEARGLTNFFYNYIMKLAAPIQEMCREGLPLNAPLRDKTGEEVRAELTHMVTKLSKEFNHRSPKQKITHFKDKGYKIPKKRKSDGTYSESLDELSMKKLRLKYPEDQDIKLLLKMSKLEKFHGSYIQFGLDKHTGRVPYSINGCGTETLRFSSSLDAWDRGFNAQTIPKKAKGFFPPPEGRVWLNVDLEKAESFFVAYRTADPTLMDMLNNNKDIHSYVAANIFNVPIEQVLAEKKAGDPSKRQLGKKSGHGANYSMAGTTFMESCLKEMDLVLTKAEANNVLETYHKLFPGIRAWHRWVRGEIYNKGKLSNPLGYHRYFYGRKDDNTYREAYAWEPQSTIPMVTNHMLLGALNQRTEGKLDFSIHLQCHDSLVFSVEPDKLEKLITFCQDTSLWHPEIVLPGGKLTIPTSAEYGTDLSNLKEYHGETLSGLY